MGEARNKSGVGHLVNAQKLPRTFFAVVFKEPHRLAGQVLRYGRNPAIAFTSNEARVMMGTILEKKYTPVEFVQIVAVTVSVKPGVEIIVIPITSAEIAEADAVEAMTEMASDMERDGTGDTISVDMGYVEVITK